MAIFRVAPGQHRGKLEDLGTGPTVRDGPGPEESRGILSKDQSGPPSKRPLFRNEENSNIICSDRNQHPRCSDSDRFIFSPWKLRIFGPNFPAIFGQVEMRQGCVAPPASNRKRSFKNFKGWDQLPSFSREEMTIYCISRYARTYHKIFEYAT